MRLSLADCELRIKSMSLKQLYLLKELFALPQYVGHNEETSYRLDPWSEFRQGVTVNYEYSAKFYKISNLVWKHIEYLYEGIHDRPFVDTVTEGLYDGYVVFVVIWDHWQACLKELVCGPCLNPRAPKSEQIFEKGYLWEESSDEEK